MKTARTWTGGNHGVGGGGCGGVGGRCTVVLTRVGGCEVASAIDDESSEWEERERATRSATAGSIQAEQMPITNRSKSSQAEQ